MTLVDRLPAAAREAFWAAWDEHAKMRLRWRGDTLRALRIVPMRGDRWLPKALAAYGLRRDGDAFVWEAT